MSESAKKGKDSKEQSTIEEGRQFAAAPLPKITNFDENLKNSYPEGFFEKSKSKHSSRKSVKISESHRKSSQAHPSPSKKDGSASKHKSDSVKKSSKKSALKRKSEKIDAANQTESSKKKITGSKSIKDTIKEGHNFIAHDSKLTDDGADKPLHKSGTMDATIEEGNKFLEQSKPRKITIDLTGK
jgi:hypothetical protein